MLTQTAFYALPKTPVSELFLYGNFKKTDLLLTFIIKSVTIKMNLCTKVMNISGEFV